MGMSAWTGDHRTEEWNMSTDEPEKLDLRSRDIAEEKRQELLRLFPEIRTESSKLDFDRLKLALGEAVDVGKERYGMNWPGKSDCFRTIQNPSVGTLLPCAKESVNFENTGNLIVEGDNLEVLKLLQKSYLGKIKTIYIDPPYNTGNDFIYPDNYAESLETYLEYTGQVDAEGKKFGTNTDADGRFHSKWLNMMYPRLYLARNLLREDGVILISIDDGEVANLRRVCGEVFGEENFLATFVRRRRMATGMRDTPISPDHEYIVAFAKMLSAARLYGFARASEDFPLQDTKGHYRSTDLTVGMTREMRPNQYYAIKNPETEVEYWPPEERVWRFEPTTMQGHISNDNIIWPDSSGRSRMTRPRFKTRFEHGDGKTNPVSSWINSRSQEENSEDSEITFLNAGLNQEATKELRDLLGEQVLDYPKPTSLIKGLLAVTTRNDDIVMDFFAGSGTTGQAVLELNEQGGGERRFILVQLPEPTQRKDYLTIAEITKERVRRVIKNLETEAAEKLDLQDGQKPDRGFRVFKLAESNLKPWDASVPHDTLALDRQLELHVSHIREGRTDQDILYEILLKSGYPLTTPVEIVVLAGQTVHSVAGGQLLICLERKLTLDLIRAMAERKPERVVCLDEGFSGNDQLKTNAAHIFEPTDRREAKSDARRFRTV
jgi:adenine-specific DNA-methyltransferase